MAGVNKKGITQSQDRRARVYFDSLSKAALIDLYIDLLRSSGGGDELDGEALIEYAKATNLETILNIRKDKPPKMPLKISGFGPKSRSELLNQLTKLESVSGVTIDSETSLVSVYLRHNLEIEQIRKIVAYYISNFEPNLSWMYR
jgi:hypothetical protein